MKMRSRFLKFLFFIRQVEPIHILCIAVKDNGDMEDEKLAKMMADFCFKHRNDLKQKSVRRITFLALNK